MDFKTERTIKLESESEDDVTYEEEFTIDKFDTSEGDNDVNSTPILDVKNTFPIVKEKSEGCDALVLNGRSPKSYNTESLKILKPFKCSECVSTFINKSQLCRHMIVHIDVMPHQCLKCKTRFKRLDGLKSHMITHEDTKPHICSVCDLSFKRLRSLQKHKSVHKDDRPFKCPECPTLFKRRDNLNVHVASLHSNSPNYVECPLCKTRVKRKSDLVKHMVVHSEDRPHKCSECGGAFKRKSQLTLHERNHSALSIQCNICCKTFSCKFSLKRHMHSHTGDGMFKCHDCGLRYTKKFNYDRHMLLHSSCKS